MFAVGQRITTLLHSRDALTVAGARTISDKHGHGVRSSILTDLEFRVWIQYQNSADDFGVMRMSALQIQSDNASLAKRPALVIQKALESLVTVRLVGTFLHQGVTYLYQNDWQTFQNRRYAKTTVLPKPPADLLADCDAQTRHLFTWHPGGMKVPQFQESSEKVPESVRNNSGIILGTFQNNSENIPETFQNNSVLTRSILTPNTKQLTPSTSPESNGHENGRDPAIAALVGEFSEKYPSIYAKVRTGAHYRGNPVRDYPHFVELVAGWELSRLEAMLEVFLHMDKKAAHNVPGTPGQFLNMAPECDRLLRENGR